MTRRKRRAAQTTTERAIAELVRQVLDKVDASPERFEAEASALGATRNQFVAMAVARLVLEHALSPDQSALEMDIAELVVGVLERADAAPETVAIEAATSATTPNQILSTLLGRLIVQLLA